MGYDILNETLVEGTVLTYECDNNLFLTGPNTITCTNAGVWSTDPREIMCVASSTATDGELFFVCSTAPSVSVCDILYRLSYLLDIVLLFLLFLLFLTSMHFNISYHNFVHLLELLTMLSW